MRFLYEEYQTAPSPTVPSGILRRPEVPLRVIGTGQDTFVQVLVDTGSDDTLLPLSIGKQIGAKLDSSQSWQAEGIGGQGVPVILGEVEMELTEGGKTFRWSAKVGFVDFAQAQDEAAVAGHAGFLDYFKATYDGQLHELEINATPGFPGKVT